VAKAFRRVSCELERNALCASPQKVLQAGSGKRVFGVNFQGSIERRPVLTLAQTLALTLALALAWAPTPTLCREGQRLDRLREKYSQQRHGCDKQSSRAAP